ncbi:hypothetical protein OSB04_004779 [Centaurea solstitialis]|uniref:Uncharacterized protein n=1 Tax=Centaurea solstitialis TaxID=347529 RepID=A0AA38TES0_9ASTR|nr:hypothetical protein OSB04_004779 [Centaurea solstitialis]
MEQNLPIMAKKAWSLVRVFFFILKKGISKTKFLADLNIIIKRGKIAGKALHNLLFHHHNHHASALRRHHLRHLSFPITTTTSSSPSSSSDSEFSCTATPPHPPPSPAKKLKHRRLAAQTHRRWRRMMALAGWLRN